MESKNKKVKTIKTELEFRKIPIKPNPKDYKGLKHWWRLDSKGEVDEFAYEDAIHNGPECIVCGFTFCEHCSPEKYEDTTCDYNIAYNKWLKKTMKIERYNEKVKIIKKYLKTYKI